MKKAVPMEQEKRKRRRELYVALVAAILIAIIFLVESEIARSAEEIPFAGHLLLFGLLSVVTLLLILVIFFLIRNLFKMLFERRQRVLGSKLKTRLTLAFVALTLVPTVVLFIASASVLHTTIESWFTAQVEDSLQSSLVVAQAYYQNASDKVVGAGSRAASLIASSALLDPPRRDDLKVSMETWRAADGLSGLYIYFRDSAPPLFAKDPALKEVALPAPVSSFLKIGFQGEKTSQIIPLEGGGDVIRGIFPVVAGDNGPVQAALVADYYIPRSLAARLFAISNAFGDYQEAKRMKGPVKTIYVLILLMVALLVIFIGFWFGMSIARDITDPILGLAEGTGKIAAGDLDVYVEPVGDDELSVLVRSFNQMAADLRKNREELVRMNLDLESRRKYMETVLKNVAAGVMALDSEKTVTAINNSAKRLLGISETDPVGRPLHEILPEESETPISEVLESLQDSDAEALERQIALSFPEKSLSLLCYANSLRDDESHDLGVVLVFEDMTHLIKAQRMAAWREVARRIAHEIKNPLTPIQLNAQRIRRKYMEVLKPDTAVLDTCTRAIVDQVEQLKHMVNEFSQFARMPAANPVPNDLNMLVGEVVELYRQGHLKTGFSFFPDQSVPIFDLDKEQMKRAMVNLLDNAVRASGTDGRVFVRTAYDPELSIASIEVADNGSGIAPSDRDRLFEPYFSRTPGGTGLGLTIVSTIVSDHNGFIRVKDNPGGGARFLIELPVRKR
ncbi:MAG: HAMP domain-containing protein [Desulfomonile tiedjei]|nr:HAMP domain-containing protein [Desulfomonile tiedjei]